MGGKGGRIEVLPTRRVRVQLVLRKPVLAVKQPGEKHRAIDAHGSPVAGHRLGAPAALLQSRAAAAGRSGMEWGDPTLRSAAQTVLFLQAQPELRKLALVESSVTGLVLTTEGGLRILWGQPADGDSATRPPPRRNATGCRALPDARQPRPARWTVAA